MWKKTHMLYAKRIIFAALLLAAAHFLWAAPAYAAQIIARDQVNIVEPANDDLYIFSGEVNVEKPVRGDVAVFGGNVDIRAPISGDVFILAGDVKIGAAVGDTVRVAGGKVRVSGRIAKDLLVAGGNVRLGENSSIGRDLLGAAGDLTMMGRIGDDLLGGFGTVTIGGRVDQDIKVNVDRLRLLPGAVVKGDVVYGSRNKADISGQAKVSGRVRQTRPAQPAPNPFAFFLGWVFSLLGKLVIGLFFAWLLPQSLARTKKALADTPWGSLGLGFGLLFLTPIAAVLLMITIIGLPLALVTLATYLVLLYLSQIFAATALGSLFLDRVAPQERWIGAGAVVGIAGLSVIQLVPILGGLATFVSILFGLGAMALAARDAWVPRHQPPNGHD